MSLFFFLWFWLVVALIYLVPAMLFVGLVAAVTQLRKPEASRARTIARVCLAAAISGSVVMALGLLFAI